MDQDDERAARLLRLERFFDLHAPIYDATRPIVLRGRRRAIERLDVRLGDSVVDFACGTGLNLPLLRSAGASHIVGADLSAKMLERARRRDPRAHLVRGDFSTMDLGERFPRALCTFALSLLPHPVEIVAAMRRHLAPDAVLVLLDFGEIEGTWGPLAPVFRAWLRRFGARTDLHDLRPALAALFHEIDVERPAAGMATIVRLARPRS